MADIKTIVEGLHDGSVIMFVPEAHGNLSAAHAACSAQGTYKARPCLVVKSSGDSITVAPFLSADESGGKILLPKP